ncbi:MAG: flagellar basal body rod protein FlgB [Campylobacterota bacterium]|nr:flagellar basal body rod protein FlgB [Campylobacterota bacterium]
MQPSSVTDLLFQQLNFRGERQKVISTNIANIDTPDYKTKELKFEDQLNKSENEYKLKLSRTHVNHISFKEEGLGGSMRLHEVQGLKEQNDGNNVNLDSQMSEMSKNSIMFSALQNSIKKDSVWFKSVIDASSKN